jgi:hypothetical protein
MGLNKTTAKKVRTSSNIYLLYGLCIPLNASPITGVRKEEKGGGGEPQHQTHPSLNRGKQ